MKIRVLGAGCKSCHQLAENTQEAIRKLGLDAEFEYVTDMAEIAKSGVMSMPALLVDGKVVSAGKVLNPKSIMKLL